MEIDISKYIRTYTRYANAWYASSLTNENIRVNISLDHIDGGTKGQLEIEWIPLRNILSPQLQVHDDGWYVMINHFQDLLQKMGEIDGQDIQVDQFCKMLDELGIKDITPYKKD